MRSSLLTEWEQFRALDLLDSRTTMAAPVVVDLQIFIGRTRWSATASLTTASAVQGSKADGSFLTAGLVAHCFLQFSHIQTVGPAE